MALPKRNFHGNMINPSPTVTEPAGVDIEDVRCRIMKYDENGNVVLAAAGTDIPLGIALIEAGNNDITGVTSGKVKKGDEVDILVKDMGIVLAGAEIKKGQEIAAGANGLAVVATSGNYVIGIALDNAAADDVVHIQIAKYQKN